MNGGKGAEVGTVVLNFKCDVKNFRRFFRVRVFLSVFDYYCFVAVLEKE